jgi:hypothetical protein
MRTPLLRNLFIALLPITVSGINSPAAAATASTKLQAAKKVNRTPRNTQAMKRKAKPVASIPLIFAPMSSDAKTKDGMLAHRMVNAVDTVEMVSVSRGLCMYARSIG